ncbi:MAG: hypothetical protein WEB53_09150 [Akkermansiaceae bacterium]
MKINSANFFKRLVLAATLLAGASLQGFAEQGAIVIRDAPTNEDMNLQLRKAQAESSKRPVADTIVSQDVSKMAKSDNLLERSIVLSFRGAAALIPKGAIIEYSEKYKDRLKKSPGDRLGDFSEFVAANRGWLSTYEVSFVQAQGKVPLDENARAQMKKNGNVVVATFRGNPIEVLPPVPSVEVTSEISFQSNRPQ